MTVVVDIGNARIKWALAGQDELLSIGAALHLHEPQLALEAMFSALPEEAERVVATNVAGKKIGDFFARAVADRWGLQPEFIETAAEQLGVTCGYAEPRRLGADRWVAMLAAHDLAPGAVCVIDAGTAVTLDTVDRNGRHLGGLIMISPRLAAAALNRQTSDIGETIAIDEAPAGLAILGHSTDEAVAHGAMLGVAAAVDRALATVAQELDVEPLILLTGGEAQSLLPWLETAVQYRSDLVLEGLALVALSN
jgi:type III pantothenate kinase